MKKFLRFLLKTVKWVFIVFCLFLGSLFFREQRFPVTWFTSVISAVVPEEIVVCADSVSFGFIRGFHLKGCRIYLRSNADALNPIASVSALDVSFIKREVVAEGLSYLRLPDSYYAPGNSEKNAPVAISLPHIGRFDLRLIRPNVLNVAPEYVAADVLVENHRLRFSDIHLVWPDKDERMAVDGSCTLDLRQQRLSGEIHGSAKQHHIRPLLETLDLPIAFPYFDGFTDVVGEVPSTCSWDVNLVNNDTDIVLGLKPTLGKYNTVPMSKADGTLKFHIMTRGNYLNYAHIIGPIHATDTKGRPLDGTITIDGLNGTNVVHIVAKSTLPVAHLIKIAGLEGDYVEDGVVGDSSCDLTFSFPTTMGEDYSKLQGHGRYEINNGQIMRMKGFSGLLTILADKVPGVSWFTDSTQAKCDYVIEDGIFKSENIYIEGSVFSIKMFGTYNCISDELNYTARVQFSKQESLMGKFLHPLTWPFTKLLLEFRLTGSSENPKWDYLSVVDRVLEVTN